MTLGNAFQGASKNHAFGAAASSMLSTERYLLDPFGFGVDVVLPLPPARARAQIAEGFNRTSINKVCIIGSIWAPPLAAGQGPGSKSLGFG